MKSVSVSLKPELTLSLWAELSQTHVSPKYEKVSHFVRKNMWILFWLSVVEVLLIPAKAIGYGVANPWTDVWNFFLKTEDSKRLSSNRRYPYDCRFRK